jgi:hypothetical protein
MTIDEIYRLVQAFASKDQRGFITPAEFNLMAQQAELELYNERLQTVIEGSQPKKEAGYYRRGLNSSVAKQDINPFNAMSSLSHSATNSNQSSALSLDSDYIISLNLSKSGSNNVLGTPIDIATPETVGQLLRSSLAKPTQSYPVALVSSSDSKEFKIEVFPKSSNRIIVNHYYYENKPKWSYVTVAGKPVYNPGASVGFKISSRCHGELVIKILSYLGVSIREADLVNYAQAKEIEQDKV